MAKTDSKFNNNPHFPFTYGDSVENDGERLSDSVVNMLKNKQVQAYLGVCSTGCTGFRQSSSTN